MVELSIIIPTHNEEKYIRRLLISINQQSYRNYEIIVSDNKSKDNTRKIAKSFDCKIVEGGLPTVARNNGAMVASGKYYLFVDADSILDKRCIEYSLKKFKKEKFDVVSSRLYVYDGNFYDKIMHALYFYFIAFLNITDLYLNGGFFLCTRKIFNKVNGFDESVKLAEEQAFGRKAAKRGAKIGILKDSRVEISTRRIKAEGRTLYIKYFLAGLYRVFFGEIRSDLFHYRFDYKK